MLDSTTIACADAVDGPVGTGPVLERAVPGDAGPKATGPEAAAPTSLPSADAAEESPAPRWTRPDDPDAMMIRWLETQGQDVWGRAILGADPRDAGSGFLYWLAGRRLDRANAVRLWWKLTHSEGDEAARRAALKQLRARARVGGFPEGQSALSRAEARFHKLAWRDAGGTEAADLPEAFFRPVAGGALDRAPTIRPVGPAPEWMGSDKETAHAEIGIALREMVCGGENPAFETQMRKRLNARRRRVWAAGAGLGTLAACAALALVAWDVPALLTGWGQMLTG